MANIRVEKDSVYMPGLEPAAEVRVSKKILAEVLEEVKKHG